MAIRKNFILGTALATFAISMMVASGPYGLAFGAALAWSSIIALALTAVIYGALEGNKNMKPGPSVSTPVTIHTPMTPKPAAVVHTQQFVPAQSQVRTPVAVVHTQQFVPAQPQVRTPAAVVHTQQFVPNPPPTHIVPPGVKTHTRHFEPAVKPGTTIHTQKFVPAAGATPITPGFSAATAAANAARTARHQAPAAHPPGVKVSSVFVPKKP